MMGESLIHGTGTEPIGVLLNCPSNCPSIRFRNIPETVTLTLSVQHIQTLDSFIKAYISTAPATDDNHELLALAALHQLYKTKVVHKALFPKAKNNLKLKSTEALALLIALLDANLPPSAQFTIQLRQITSTLHQQLI